jgi:hypothetical protein
MGGIMNYEDIYQKFVGNDKIQPLRVQKGENGSFILIYKEGRRNQQIKCEDRNTLDMILIEFGGKNPETCKTEGRFLNIDGKWGAEDINQLGHTITKVRISGDRTLRNSRVPIYLPESTGFFGPIHSKTINQSEIMLLLTDKESISLTRSFNDPTEFDELINFIFDHKSLRELKWRLEILCTESREVGKQCLWKRVQAGDGTKRMVLQLQQLNGVDFQGCVRQDLFDAAGDMFDAPCKRVKVKKMKNQEKDICLFAAEDGSVDLEGYEAVS